MIYYYKKKLRNCQYFEQRPQKQQQQDQLVVIRIIDNSGCVGKHLVRTQNYQNAQTSLVLSFVFIQGIF